MLLLRWDESKGASAFGIQIPPYSRTFPDLE